MSEYAGHEGLDDPRQHEADALGHLAENTGEPVVLSAAATSSSLAIIRSVAERVLYDADWPVDDVADLLLGIDEIGTQLVAGAQEGTRIELCVAAGEQAMRGRLVGRLAPGVELNTSGFGWRVVETVTDAVTVNVADDGDQRVGAVAFAKVR